MKACAALAFAAGLACYGCALLAEEAAVSVILPAPPLVWLRAFPELSCRVVYQDAYGIARCVPVEDWSRSITISCPKDRNTPVLAFPITRHDTAAGSTGGGYLRPAGGLYPLSLDSRPGKDALVLTWKDGALALIMARLRGAGRDVSSFNAARLAAYMDKVSDPWTLDFEGITELIACGGFTANDVRALPHYPVRVPSLSGAWFLESALCPALQGAEGMLDVPSVPQGMHTLFSEQGDLILLQVDERGAMIMK